VVCASRFTIFRSMLSGNPLHCHQIISTTMSCIYAGLPSALPWLRNRRHPLKAMSTGNFSSHPYPLNPFPVRKRIHCHPATRMRKTRNGISMSLLGESDYYFVHRSSCSPSQDFCSLSEVLVECDSGRTAWTWPPRVDSSALTRFCLGVGALAGPSELRPKCLGLDRAPHVILQLASGWRAGCPSPPTEG